MWINNYLQPFTQQYPNTGTTLYSSHGQRWQSRQYICLLQIYNGTLVSAIDYALFPTRHCSYSDLILNAVSSSGFPRRWRIDCPIYLALLFNAPGHNLNSWSRFLSNQTNERSPISVIMIWSTCDRLFHSIYNSFRKTIWRYLLITK
jgi:hypothetical protein